MSPPSTKVTNMLTRKALILPSVTMTFCSLIHAPSTFLSVLSALAIPFSIASSKLFAEVDVISMTLAKLFHPNSPRANLGMIHGRDAWLPKVLFLYGLDTQTGRPNEIVHLVSIPEWDLGMLSTDAQEGKPSVPLPVV